MLQEEALSILKTGRNVFLTGEPGSGKTYTINRYVEWLNSNRIQVAVTASTGIAASHINGQTIHSWSGIGIKSIITSDDLSKIRNNKHVAKRIAETKVLIIDEVSLLQSKTLSVIERVCRTIRRSAEVFGGIQIVLVGDFFQIPPVEEFNASSNDAGSDFFSMRPQDDRKFAFESSVWSELRLAICYLSEQHRQEDEQFLELLSAIRKNSVSEAHRILLKARIFREPPDGVPKLFSSNAQVDHLNQQVIDKIKEEEITYPMEERGPKALVDRLKKFCLSPELLTLKKGAQVMFTKNDFVKRQYVNGTLGIVHEIKNGAPIVRTKKGGFIEVGPSEWKIEERGLAVAEIKQLPLRLAWAITIHKSQGMSLDAAFMDLRNVFEYGQGYVALSRIRTITGLSIAGFNERALQVHPTVSAKDEEFRSNSKAAREELMQIDEQALINLQNQFVEVSKRPVSTCDAEKTWGVKKPSGTHESSKAYSVEVIRNEHPNAYTPWDEKEDEDLKRRYLAGESLQSISKALGRQRGSISSRLKKLGLK